MSVLVLGREELASIAVGLLSLHEVAVIGVGLCKGHVEPFKVATALSALHRVTAAAYRHQYESAGDPGHASPLEIMRDMGRLLGIRGEPIPSPTEPGSYEWEALGNGAIHDRAWRFMRNPGHVRVARRGAWSLVYNAIDNSGHNHMSDEDRDTAMWVCQALLVLDD